MVSNAARGVSPFEELSIPVASARLRVSGTRGAARKFKVVVNGFESAVLLRMLVSDDFRIDWERTTSSGAFVLVTRNARIIDGDAGEVGGFAAAPVVVISVFAPDPTRTMRHEVVHVQQQRFMHDAWGRPIEGFLLSKIPGARHMPSWLELGLVAPGLIMIDDWLIRRNGLVSVLQAEAERLERR
jgi:hypothetical protein